MLTLPRLIYHNKLCPLPLPPPGTFANTTILITGGTSGLGLATAVHFLNLGAATVIITARTTAKGEAAKTLIASQVRYVGGSEMGKVVVRLLDMGTFEGIMKFAEGVKKEVRSVDYVLLNAGVINSSFQLGSEGFEETLMVNTLGTALLAILLLPWLKSAGKGSGHMGIVSSGNHRGVDIAPGKWPQQDILAYYSKEENWPGGPGMYAISKLLVQYCTNEIAKLDIGADRSPQVIVNSMNPGMVKSDLGRNYRKNALSAAAIDVYMFICHKTTEVGARRLVLAAMTTKDENGKYLSDLPDEEYNAAVEKNVLGLEGQKMQKLVWNKVLAILGKHVPEIRHIVGSGAV